MSTLSLFPDQSNNPHVNSGAVFSDCRKYRYQLWRIWDQRKDYIMFIGLNPSKADETNSDPTITRVIQFAKDWGFGGVFMMNLFAWVSTDPDQLLTVADPQGDNDKHLHEVAKQCQTVVFAWGAFKQNKERAKEVAARFPEAIALVINKDGSPRHPLYVKGDVVPVMFKTKSTHDA